MFLAFEGVDGAGKDTQLKLLLAYFIDQDKHRVITKSREPSRMTPAGKRLNEIAQQHIEISALETATLFAADRRDLEPFRRSILAHDSDILQSRTDLSTYAYQGYAMGLGFDTIWQLHEGIFTPDVTLFIHISAETMLARLGDRAGAKELYEQEDFLLKCHAGYSKAIEFLRDKGRNIQVIDGEGSVEEVFEKIKNIGIV